MRVAKAQDEYSEYYDTDKEIRKENKMQKLYYLQKKYDIPTDVYLFSSFTDEKGFFRKGIIECKKHISAFVRGELSDSTFSDLYFFFEEFYECDYPWILIEKPAGFYGAGGAECKIEELISELKSIGCRSKVKNKKLPDIVPGFSGYPRKVYQKLAPELGWELHAL